jgi:hypothetical protein
MQRGYAEIKALGALDQVADRSCGDCHSQEFGYELGYAKTSRCRYSWDIDA